MTTCPYCPRSFPSDGALARHVEFEHDGTEPSYTPPEELLTGSMGEYEPGSPEAIAAVERHELELAERQVRAARQAAELAFNEPEQRSARALEGIHYELHRLVNLLSEPGGQSASTTDEAGSTATSPDVPPGSPARGPG